MQVNTFDVWIINLEHLRNLSDESVVDGEKYILQVFLLHHIPLLICNISLYLASQ